jgi:hypothetical protein
MPARLSAGRTYSVSPFGDQARHQITGIIGLVPHDHPGGQRMRPHRRRSRLSLSRSSSAPTSAVRYERLRIIVACSRASRAWIWCPCAAAVRPEPRRARHAAILRVAGPMARSAGNSALGLEVLAGPDELSDGIGYKLALPPACPSSGAQGLSRAADRRPSALPNREQRRERVGSAG